GEVERPADVEPLRRGVALLQRYLGVVRTHSVGQASHHRWILYGAAAVIVLEAIGLSVTASLWMLLAALFAVPLAVLALRQNRRPDQETQQLREDFGRLGLAVPQTWSVDQVQARLVELQREVNNATLE